MEHLDESSQSVIDQLMYDEQQKKLGLPTSKEQVCGTNKGFRKCPAKIAYCEDLVG